MRKERLFDLKDVKTEASLLQSPASITHLLHKLFMHMLLTRRTGSVFVEVWWRAVRRCAALVRVWMDPSSGSREETSRRTVKDGWKDYKASTSDIS